MATAMWNLGQVTLLDDGKGSTWPPSKKLPIYRCLVPEEVSGRAFGEVVGVIESVPTYIFVSLYLGIK